MSQLALAVHKEWWYLNKSGAVASFLCFILWGGGQVMPPGKLCLLSLCFDAFSIDCQPSYLYTNIEKLLHLCNGSACDMGCHFNHVPKVYTPPSRTLSFIFISFLVFSPDSVKSNSASHVNIIESISFAN